MNHTDSINNRKNTDNLNRRENTDNLNQRGNSSLKEEGKLLEVSQLTIRFPRRDSQRGQKSGYASVVNGVDFSMEAGEILGIVGESGSGKTMTALSVMGLLPAQARVSGHAYFMGEDIFTYGKKERKALQGQEIAMIFQEPMTSFNPLLKVGAQVEEMLLLHGHSDRQEVRTRTLKKFEEVGLHDPADVYDKYPNQLSGGMRQRAMIAMAMMCNPKLLIADEPTTALDVTVQEQILKLIRRLNEEYGTAVIFISHDLGVVKSLCKRVLVMKDGSIVEEGPMEEVLFRPAMEYTKELIQAVPSIYHRLSLRGTEGEKPSATEADTLLRIRNMDAFYEEKQQKFFAKSKRNQILKNIDLELKKGEILGVVGESGCGKSTLAKVIAGLHTDRTGHMELTGESPQMVFQDAYGSLNPGRKVGWILEEPLKIQGGYSRAERKKEVEKMLEQVGLGPEHAMRYLHELSGGQRQRVSIAAAMMRGSEFVILDEPVSALDVTVQAQILKLLLELRRIHNLTYLFISHDLNVIGEVCDRVCVMHEGRIVECADVDQLFRNPQHGYSKVLLGAIPSVEEWGTRI